MDDKMDILRPDLAVIEGRAYRRLQPRTQTNPSNDFFPPMDSEDLFPECEENPQSEEDVEQVKDGYILRMDIPSVFYKYLIGKAGAVKRDIERDCDCAIRIPRQGEAGPVEIFSRAAANVSRARAQLELKVEVGKGKEGYTHFAGIMLQGQEVSRNLSLFKEQCLGRHSADAGVCPEVFQTPCKFHLTLGMMKLFTQKDKDAAARLLEDCVQKVVKPLLPPRPLTIELRGLEIMRDDPRTAHVLYAKAQASDGSDVCVRTYTLRGPMEGLYRCILAMEPDAVGTSSPAYIRVTYSALPNDTMNTVYTVVRLQRLVDGVAKAFIESGLMEKSFGRESVKIHATLMNSKWKSQGRNGSGKLNGPKWKRHSDPIDVRGILSEFEGLSFGSVAVGSLHLLSRGVYNVDGSYQVLAQAKFLSH